MKAKAKKKKNKKITGKRKDVKRTQNSTQKNQKRKKLEPYNRTTRGFKRRYAKKDQQLTEKNNESRKTSTLELNITKIGMVKKMETIRNKKLI